MPLLPCDVVELVPVPDDPLLALLQQTPQKPLPPLRHKSARSTEGGDQHPVDHRPADELEDTKAADKEGGFSRAEEPVDLRERRDEESKDEHEGEAMQTKLLLLLP
eukprot:768335-Hanusia_phi.AAC.7